MIEKIQLSLSADQSSTPAGALVACLSVIVLEINDNKIDSLRANFKNWATYAQPFASKIGVGPEFKAVCKRVLAKDDLYGDDEDIVELGRLLKSRDVRDAIEADTKVPREIVKLIQACARSLYKDDEKAWNYIEKHISVLRNPQLASEFVNDDDAPVAIDGIDASAASKKMRIAYQRLMGHPPKDGYYINPLEIRQIREAKPKEFEEYSRLAKILNKEVKRLVFRYVRNKRAETVSVDEVSKFLDKSGLLHNLPRGFTGGQIDENMNYYTAEGRKLDRAPFGTVRMNPKYDPTSDNTYVLYIQGYGKRNGKDVAAGRVRTVSFLNSNKAARSRKVAEFIENEAKLRAKWIKDLNRKGTKEQIMAALVEMMWATSARIGGKGNKSAGEPTYGMTTLKASHVRIKGNKILFDYVGKKGAKQFATYFVKSPESRKVKEIVEKLIEGKDPDDLLFTFRNRAILRHAVNKYLASLGCPSAHYFRRIKGTQVAMEILAASPFHAKYRKEGKVKESEVNKWFKEEMKRVGEILHHRNGENVTGMTAVRSYISPEVIENFYSSLGLRVPSFVPLGKKEE